MTTIEKKDLKIYLEGSDGQPAINGGYLYIYQDDELLTIASIPSPNLMADNSSQSTVENDEQFQDKDGNEYSIMIFSSMHGIDWVLDIYPKDEDIIKKISYKVKHNEY